MTVLLNDEIMEFDVVKDIWENITWQSITEFYVEYPQKSKSHYFLDFHFW